MSDTRTKTVAAVFPNRHSSRIVPKGPQLDTEQVPQSTLPDERKTSFWSNLCEEQTAMLERPLPAEQHQSLHR